MNFQVILFIGLLWSIQHVSGLKCYECFHTNNTQLGNLKNEDCTNPEKIPTKDGSVKDCTGRMSGMASLGMGFLGGADKINFLKGGDTPACIYINIVAQNNLIVARDCANVSAIYLNKCIPGPFTEPSKGETGEACACNGDNCNGKRSTSDKPDKTPGGPEGPSGGNKSTEPPADGSGDPAGPGGSDNSADKMMSKNYLNIIIFHLVVFTYRFY